MYEDHFGMQGRPFDSGIAQDLDVFRGSPQEALIAKFKQALAVPDSVVVLTGPAGVGKTTLTSAALRATSTRLALAWLNAVPTNATELLELLLVELGVNAHRTTRIERLQMWRQTLSELSATDSRVFVIAERTEDLAPDVLRALDSLTAADASGSPGANVVLLGRPGLDQLLAQPAYDSLRQRIRLRQKLAPFGAAELTDYLRHRVTSAGGDFARVFAPDAAAAVHRYSGGLARVANNLCEAALGVAAAEGKPSLTAELIARVAVDLLGLGEESASPAPVATVTPAVTAAAVTPVAPASDRAAPSAAPVAPTVTFTSAAIDVIPPKTTAPPIASTVVPPAIAVAPPPVASAPVVPATASPKATSPRPEVPDVHTAAPAPVTRSAAPAPPQAPPRPPLPVTQAAAPPPVTQPIPSPLAQSAPMAAAGTPRRAPPAPLQHTDFDATATDIPDVASFDFPVLTDAVEEPPAPVARAPLPQAAPRPAPSPSPKAPPAPAAAAPRAPTAPAQRATTPRAAAPAPAKPQPEAKHAAATPPAPAATADGDGDAQRQTQTMRAISLAKSIDDVSDSMAETLFGEAELDFLSATLASAVGEDGAAPAASAPAPAAAPRPPKDDFMDLFNLGPDAPLELIDDSSTPEGHRSRKAANRR